ncbi:MAG: RNA polymerase sigma factor [Lachnospiraceae bacterium]|nr:RNA polymerase sigma factor [Lachnospiraceae bacterium]
MLFSDMQAELDEEPFEFSIEDEDLSHQPELAYTREETVQLMHEMMDALSEEQRVCILMIHIDGIPIKEIAETLGCSENTVKSRLNYARKNIKKQGEELQKKGYQLYGIAPFTLLLLLLHKDAYAMSGEAEFLSAGEKLEQEIFKNSSSFMDKSAGSTITGERAGDPAIGIGDAGESAASSSAAGNAAADISAKTAAGAAVKSAFLGTAAGKLRSVWSEQS